MTAEASERRARWLLAAGVVAGTLLAAVALIRSGPVGGGLPAGTVAVVNGEPITEEAFRRLETAVVAERRGAALEPEQRQRLLDRLVDEELLLQRGLELGLARHEPGARRAIVSAVVAAVTADAETVDPDEATLRGFHESEAARFQRPGRVVADAVFVSTAQRPEAEAFRRAAEATSRLRAGEEAGAVEAALGDPQTAPLPEGPVALETVRQYLGPSAAQALAALQPEGVSDPVRGAAGYTVLRLRHRAGGETAPFEEVREQVLAEWLRVQGEKALGEYLEGLREQGQVEAALPPPPAGAPS